MLNLYRAFLFLCVAASALAQSGQKPPKRYTKVPAGYLMVLQQGDNILNKLEEFARSESIPSANFTGMGFVNVEFGFFDPSKKTYKPRRFNNVELASMHGTIAWQKGKVSIHAHGVVGDDTFNAYAGHILSAVVSTGSVEIMITVHNKRLERKQDPKLGANVLSFE